MENTVAKIVKSINESKFTASECADIFCALVSQNEALGGKFWTTDDIRLRLNDNYKVDLPDEFVDQIANDFNDYNSAILDDCTFIEWNAIDTAIRDAGIMIHVTDIIWDVDRANFDNEAEYQAVMENLPDAVDVPLSALEYNVEVIDYLSDKYNYCVSACCYKEVSENV